ncbi:MAG: hypothetical protein ACOC5J_03680 [Gemmatimonadota bacterium]
MRTLTTVLSASMTLLMLGACGQVTDLENGERQGVLYQSQALPFISTDRDSYQAQAGQIEIEGESIGFVEFTIQMTYTNRSTAPVYIGMYCGGVFPIPPILERHVNDRWKTAYAPPSSACSGRSLRIERGGTYHYEFRVRGYDPSSSVRPVWRPDGVNGTYRIRWDHTVRTTPDLPPDRVPLEEGVSNTFQVEGTLPWGM